MTCYISARHHTGRLLSHADNLQMAKNFHLPQSQRDWEKKEEEEKKISNFSFKFNPIHHNLHIFAFTHIRCYYETWRL